MNKKKNVSVSHELYQEVIRNAVDFMKEHEKKEGEGSTISQNFLADYLLTLNFENNMLNS